MTLNLNLIESIIPAIHTKKLAERSKILDRFKKINSLFQKKMTFFNNIIEIKGRLLINQQILEEHKKTKSEIISSYKLQYEDIFSNFVRKDLVLKKFHKKFLDVEKYVHREFTKIPSVKQKFYKEFRIEAYIVENENLKQAKNIIQSENEHLELNIKMIQKENIQLKIRENITLSKNDLIKNDDINQKDEKYTSLIKSYSVKISFLQNRILKFKQYSEFLFKKIQLNNNNNNNNENKINYEEIDNLFENDLDEKTINVSILSNIKPNDSNYLTTNEGILTKRSNFGWDVSRIEKNID